MHILCTICSDLVNQAENIHVTKCGHIFHYHCLSQWIARSKSCPQCRNKVTDKCTFRMYPTISNESSGDDVATLQSRLDNVQLELRQQATACKEASEKVSKAEIELKKYEENIKSLEKKLISRDSAVSALKEQLEYVKIQNRETQKLKEENEVLKKNMQTLTGLQKVLNATSDEVEQMLQGYTDVRTIATFATALKRALCESESKKNECRDSLQRAKQQLALEKINFTDLQAKYMQIQEKLTSTEKKYEALQNKRKAAECLDKSYIDDSWNISPKPKQRKSEPEFSLNDAIMVLDNNMSFNSMVNKIENADSPYLNLKQSSLALSTLQRPPALMGDSKLKPSEFAILNSARNITVRNKGPSSSSSSQNVPSNSQNKDLSIFHKKEPVKINLDDKLPPKSDLDVSYDGLGGHSRLDKFPVPISWKTKGVPKLTAKHKLKKPATTGCKDIGAMLAELRDKT